MIEKCERTKKEVEQLKEYYMSLYYAIECKIIDLLHFIKKQTMKV